MSSTAQWPSLVEPVVSLFGHEKVSRVAEEALGYPATWVTEVSEVRSLVQALKAKEG